jgi:hypothetical protein
MKTRLSYISAVSDQGQGEWKNERKKRNATHAQMQQLNVVF